MINNLGVLIFEVPRIEMSEMSALCLYFDEYPIILLNGADSVNGRIFSLFHELTHLLKKQNAICDLDENNSKEIFCNRVSAEFLVPKDDLLKNKIVVNHKRQWDDNDLELLSHEYGVSKETILLRLVSLNKISNDFYINKKNEWFNNSVSKNSSGGNPVLTQVKYNGKAYSRLVYNAYENGIISSLEFSQAIGLKLKHIDFLDSYLMG